MTNKKPKTLDDFPSFTVTRVRRGETFETGYIKFELDGSFSRIVGLDSHWFWLLIGESDCVTAELKSLDKNTGAATVIATEKENDMPNLLGKKLFYLSPYWQAYNVWMVLDPNWGWERVQFQTADAVAENDEAPDISIVDGREVRKWTKLERADKKGHVSRYYPAQDQSSTEASPKTIPHGWDHEHCDLCRVHINAGVFGYRDPDDRWMCESCYEKYVMLRDLSFVDEL